MPLLLESPLVTNCAAVRSWVTHVWMMPRWEVGKREEREERGLTCRAARPQSHRWWPRRRRRCQSGRTSPGRRTGFRRPQGAPFAQPGTLRPATTLRPALPPRGTPWSARRGTPTPHPRSTRYGGSGTGALRAGTRFKRPIRCFADLKSQTQWFFSILCCSPALHLQYRYLSDKGPSQPANPTEALKRSQFTTAASFSRLLPRLHRCC